MLIGRRAWLAGAGALLLGGRAAAAAVDASGLHSEPWFLQSFLDLGEDLAAASAAGKRLVILIEQKGCPACQRLHEVNLADAAIVDFVRERFEVLVLDLHGARPVTDLDGSVREERVFARRAAGAMTPTALFLPRTPAEVAGRPAAEAAVARMTGYLPPREFLGLFRWVAEEGYRREGLAEFLARTS